MASVSRVWRESGRWNFAIIEEPVGATILSADDRSTSLDRGRMRNNKTSIGGGVIVLIGEGFLDRRCAFAEGIVNVCVTGYRSVIRQRQHLSDSERRAFIVCSVRTPAIIDFH